jgi:hypothetical protein
MGYWITHHITVQGKTEYIDALEKKLQAPHPKQLNDEGDIVWSDEGIDSVSLYNLSPPPEDMLISGEWWTAEGNVWRAQNWDCTYNWQAHELDSYVNSTNAGSSTLHIRFETKYDWPREPFLKLIEDNPGLKFSIWSEGEESEALEIHGESGLYDITEYDSPASHADWVSRDSADSCRCGWADDPNDWFDDCPRDTIGEYEVVVTYKHKVKAYDSYSAMNTLHQYENEFDIHPDCKMITYDVMPLIEATLIEQTPE